MSRPVRRKNPTTPVKASKRRGSDSSSSLDLSDDDGYSAVEDISDSEDDDEEDVNAAEEENILTERSKQPPGSPRPQSIENDDEGDAEDDDEDNDDAAEADPYESTSWAGIVSDGEDHQVSDFYQEASFGSDTVERHVRFDLPSSESDSTETEDDYGDLFPDIFVSQNSLDPAFRREIESDPDESSGSASFWDFHSQSDRDHPESEVEDVIRELDDDVTPTATPSGSRLATDDSTPVAEYEEPQDLDGYESESCLNAGQVVFHANAPSRW